MCAPRPTERGGKVFVCVFAKDAAARGAQVLDFSASTIKTVANLSRWRRAKVNFCERALDHAVVNLRPWKSLNF